MKVLHTLLKRLRFSRAPSLDAGLDSAQRAPELNAAISSLWLAEATHTQAAFEKDIVPIYLAVLSALRHQVTQDQAEAALLTLLQDTANACRYRWSVRLPMKRPGSDYRRYEMLYTYALLTAMALDSLVTLDGDESVSPEIWAARILPANGLAQLRSDPVVWDDWLGFFRQSEVGGLYAVSQGLNQTAAVTDNTSAADIAGETSRQKVATFNVAKQDVPSTQRTLNSGVEMLEAIKFGLEDGCLAFNNPGDPVQVDRQGRTFLEYPAILEWCIDRLKLDKSFKQAKKQFDSTRTFKRSASGHHLYRGRLRARDSRLQGYVFEDASTLWRAKPPNGRFVIENLTALK